MSFRVNKVILIGNLTKDPEVRYTPKGNAVASFSIATNREWTVEGNKKEVVDFHNVVSWNKLAELCGQLLSKGSKVYVEGRLQTRDWVTEDGQKRYKTEVVIDEMIVLSSKRPGEASGGGEGEVTEHAPEEPQNFEDIDLDQVLSGGQPE